LSAPDLGFDYDTFGDVQLNRMNDVVAAAIAQDPLLGSSVHDFLVSYLFEPLGMRQSSWDGDNPDKTFAVGWSTTARDMARLGLLMLDGGMWNGERLVGEDWIYRMTHPSFEIANTGYGYLTWLIARSNADDGDGTPRTTSRTPNVRRRQSGTSSLTASRSRRTATTSRPSTAARISMSASGTQPA
jgi:hypothetical protein